MSTRRDIVGLIGRRTTRDIVKRFLNKRLRNRRRTIVFFVNANFITSCQQLGQVISKSPDIFLLNDGLALNTAYFLRFGAPFPGNLKGTDFTWSLLFRVGQETRVSLLGGRPGVVEAMAKVFDGISRVRIAGFTGGYSIWDDEVGVIEQIKKAEPDILLVAFDNPLQEEWVLHNRGATDVLVIMAVGAPFNFVSGYASRAPKFLHAMSADYSPTPRKKMEVRTTVPRRA